MRIGRFDDGTPRPCVLLDQQVMDLRAVTEASDVLACLTDKAQRDAVDRIARGRPPSHHTRRAENVRMLPPLEPGRIVLAGGAQGDVAPAHFVPPRGGLPSGPWHTGVAAVIAHDVDDVGEDWMVHVAGWTPFHLVHDHLALGPWIADWDEVPDWKALAFSAFVDDMPRIRPSKALLDWAAVMGAALPLQAGDLVALSAPPETASGPVRSALVADGRVLSRLEAIIAP